MIIYFIYLKVDAARSRVLDKFGGERRRVYNELAQYILDLERFLKRYHDHPSFGR